MTQDGTEDEGTDAASRHLHDLRREFWERVRAQDRQGAQRIRGEILRFPEESGSQLYRHPAVSAAWSEVFGDVDLPLGFIGKVETPPAVWEAKAELERLGGALETRREGLPGSGERPEAWEAAGGAYDQLRRFYAALDPELRRHPIIRKAVARGTHGFSALSEDPTETLTEEDRADLRRRRLYRWRQDPKPILFMAELTPPSDEAAADWLEDKLGTEQRIKGLIDAAGERFVQLYWTLEPSRAALLLTFGVDSVHGVDDVSAALASSGLFTVERTTRVLTSEELWYSNTQPPPFGDWFREEDLDEEEREALRRYRQRKEESTRAILATVPCHVCGRFVAPGETYAINRVGKGGSIISEDGTVEVEGPTMLVYCSDHRK
ncbi:MAG: hypothetical protein JOZ41_20645 [Chloroflexi bacterium]|nr:hypothetical protein [Chloroflexota bacterium]